MAISVSQRPSGHDTGGLTGSIAVAFGSDNTVHNAIIAIGIIDGASTSLLGTPADTQGNAYSLVKDFPVSGNLGIRVWANYDIKAGPNTVTMTDGNNISALHLYEVVGLASSAAFDDSANQHQSSATALDSTNTGTTLRANELLLGIFASTAATSQTFTVGTGYSNIVNDGIAFLSTATEEKIVSSIGAYNATATLSSNSDNQLSAIVTFADTSVNGDNINISENITASESLNHYSDLVNINENVRLMQASYNDSVLDNLVLSESLNRYLDQIDIGERTLILSTENINASDSVTTSESVSLFLGATDSVLDNLTATESVTPRLISNISVSDTASTSESVSILLASPSSVSDSLSLTDLPSRYSDQIDVGEKTQLLVTDFDSVSDSITISESLDHYSDQINLNENTQLLVAADPLSVSVSDTVATSDFIDVIRGAIRDVFIRDNGHLVTDENGNPILDEDGHYITDNGSTEILFLAEAVGHYSDLVIVSDKSSVILVSLIKTSDTVTFSESFSLVNNQNKFVTDTITLSESVKLLFTRSLSRSETVTTSENTNVAIANLINVNDTLTLSENTSLINPTMFINTSNSITLNEASLVSSVSGGVVILDSIVTSESSQVAAPLSLRVNDTVTTSENIQNQKISSNSVSDTATFSESVSVNVAFVKSVSDQIILTENVAVAAPSTNINQSETVTTDEAIALEVFFDKQVVATPDTLTLSESVSAFITFPHAPVFITVIGEPLDVILEVKSSNLTLDGTENVMNITLSEETLETTITE